MKLTMLIAVALAGCGSVPSPVDQTDAADAAHDSVADAAEAMDGMEMDGMEMTDGASADSRETEASPPDSSRCPETRPEPNSHCDLPNGTSCQYGRNATGCDSDFAQCNDGAWLVVGTPGCGGDQ
jgi:hypothetical protein